MNRLIVNIFRGQVNRGIMIPIMKVLLMDRTTRKNIFWNTDEYKEYGNGFQAEDEITPDLVCGDQGNLLQPRTAKNKELQGKRTLEHAEVFTPLWICNLQNNLLDASWFGTENIFNTPNGTKWITHHQKIVFPDKHGKNWKDYVDTKRLEITCGEAPYVVSPYDTITGHKIPLENRIGILDRKLRIVNENTRDETEWLKWIMRAYQSTYGFEYQGDSLTIARLNLLLTFVENMVKKWNRLATKQELNDIAKIISWNFWQMDGLTGTVPGGKPEEQYESQDLFASPDTTEVKPSCRIMDWHNQKKSFIFRKIYE